MKEFYVIAIIVMIFVVIFQIAKASEYVSVLKGEEKSKKQNNRINGIHRFGQLANQVLKMSIGTRKTNDGECSLG